MYVYVKNGLRESRWREGDLIPLPGDQMSLRLRGKNEFIRGRVLILKAPDGNTLIDMATEILLQVPALHLADNPQLVRLARMVLADAAESTIVPE